jgi:hypothetical protein
LNKASHILSGNPWLTKSSLLPFISHPLAGLVEQYKIPTTTLPVDPSDTNLKLHPIMDQLKSQYQQIGPQT